MKKEAHSYKYDFSRWPLVVSCQYGDPTRPEVEAFYSTFDGSLARGDLYFSIALIDHSDHSSTVGKDVAADWIKRNREAIGRQSLGAALVIRSTLLRGLVKAFMMFNRVPGGATQIVSTMEEALDLAQQAFQQAGVVLAPAPRDWPRIGQS